MIQLIVKDLKLKEIRHLKQELAETNRGIRSKKIAEIVNSQAQK